MQTKGGLQDFWAVFRAQRAEVGAATVKAFQADANLAVLVGHAHDARLIEEAVQDDHADSTLALVGKYAHIGIDFKSWHELSGIFAGIMLPHLTRALGAHPERLASSVSAMYELMERSIALLGEEYRKINTRKLSESQALNRTLEERRKSDQTLRALMESAPDGMIIVDDQGVIILVNGQIERMYQYSRAELLGQKANILLPPDTPVSFVATDKRVYGEDLDLTGLRKDGTRFPVEISMSPLATDDGIFASSTIRDISERWDNEMARAEMADALARRAMDLEVVNEELESFSYSVSHDLRGPLRALDGFSRQLLKTANDKLDDGEKEYLQRIRGASQKMGRLIDDLLNLSRITRDKLDMKSVNLSNLAHKIVAELRDAPAVSTAIPSPRPNGNSPCQVDIAPDLEAFGDEALLEIALQNLLGNAWKFTRKATAPRISFGAVGNDRTRTYFVRDNGAGFDMEYSSKLFVAFQRLHTPEAFDGTGIGLATVKRVVNRHGGRIWAEGEPGKGATFYFTLEPGEH